MDDKGNRRLKAGNRWRRGKDVGTNGLGVVKRGFTKCSKFLSMHKQMLLTSTLLALMVVLLFGISSRLQPPTLSPAPSGVTVVDYSTFVTEVKAGNVLGVTIQHNGINGLLVGPLGHGQAALVVLTPSQRAADLAAWMRFIGGSSSSWRLSPAPTMIDPARTIYTRLPVGGDVALMPLLRSNHVAITVLPATQAALWLQLLWGFGPIVLVVLVVLLVGAFRRRGSSSRMLDDRITGLGKSRVRRFDRTKGKRALRPGPGKASTLGSGKAARVSLEASAAVTFADVAGIDEVRADLEEIVQFLHSPERFQRLGARIPRGALLVGPPGTGKTLLAKAIAGEADVPFFTMSASEFVEVYVGVGASRVRDLFSQARQAAPCVIFLDEIDAVGRKRSMRVNGSDEREQTLNQLLVELDGFDSHQAVVVLAATNRADVLDKALLRPGRFDRQITVSLPDRVGREAILKVHSRETPLHEEVSLARLSRMTTGMSGADLANLVNEAALCAARQDLNSLTHDCFEDALARVQLGALRPLVMSEADRRTIAFHESGHALVAYHLPEADTVHRVTILPRGQSLGVTQFIAEEDRYNYSRETLMARIAVGLGGRVAEELTFGWERVTTGAENDLQVVTDLARRMVMRWGMSEQVGVIFADSAAEGAGVGLTLRAIDLPVRSRALVADADGHLLLDGAVEPRYQHTFAMMSTAASNANSATMATLIDASVQAILHEGQEMARALLSEHDAQLTAIANTLMEHEHLDRAQFEALLGE